VLIKNLIVTGQGSSPYQDELLKQDYTTNSGVTQLQWFV